jgi:phosphoglycolate phosphatase
MTNNLKGLLIFDLDGTLFKTESVTIPAVQSTLQDHGLKIPGEDEICSYIGKPSNVYHDWLRTLCPPIIAEEIIADIDILELDLIDTKGMLYPQTLEVLDQLTFLANQMALCTNGPKEYVERVMHTKGLKKYFDYFRFHQGRNDHKVSKVRDILNRTKIRPAIVIGDRYDDIFAANLNGILSIGVSYGYGTMEEISSAHAIAESPSKLPTLVLSLIENG